MKISVAKSIEEVLEVIPNALADIGGAHPMVVHFPIALLFICPLFIVLALIFKNSQKHLNLSALILMIIGLIGIYIAIFTGNQAAEPLELTNARAIHILEEHYVLAGQARLNFSILTFIFLGYVLFFDKLSAKFSKKINVIAISLYLLLFIISLFILANGAHHGAKLVHEQKIHSTLFAPNK